jgi:hypothetical protein
MYLGTVIVCVDVGVYPFLLSASVDLSVLQYPVY